MHDIMPLYEMHDSKDTIYMVNSEALMDAERRTIAVDIQVRNKLKVAAAQRGITMQVLIERLVSRVDEFLPLVTPDVQKESQNAGSKEVGGG